MKRHPVHLLLILLAVMAVSCKKKDKGSGNSLLGQWNGTQITLKFQQGPLTFDSTYKITPPDYFKLHFKSQNQVDINVSMEGDQSQGTGYYVTRGNQLTLMESEDATDPDQTTFTYKVSGSQLTLTTSSKDTIDNEVITGQEIIRLTRQ